jgi:hypothetical protein
MRRNPRAAVPHPPSDASTFEVLPAARQPASAIRFRSSSDTGSGLYSRTLRRAVIASPKLPSHLVLVRGGPAGTVRPCLRASSASIVTLSPTIVPPLSSGNSAPTPKSLRLSSRVRRCGVDHRQHQLRALACSLDHVPKVDLSGISPLLSPWRSPAPSFVVGCLVVAVWRWVEGDVDIFEAFAALGFGLGGVDAAVPGGEVNVVGERGEQGSGM